MALTNRRVEIQEERRILDDFFKVDEAILRYETFSGDMSQTQRRLSVDRGDAVAAIVVERETGDVLLTEQFRYPTYDKGPGWLVEAPAGVIEDGDDPEETIRREILEEMGYRLGDVESIAQCFLSPGGSSERIFLYFAEVSAADRVAEGGGLDEEGEDIRLVRLAATEIDDALASNRFADAKTIVGLMWLRNNRSGAAEQG